MTQSMVSENLYLDMCLQCDCQNAVNIMFSESNIKNYMQSVKCIKLTIYFKHI